MAEPKLLTVRMAMERLSIGRTFIYDLINAGLLKTVKLPAPPRKSGSARAKPVRPVTRITIESIRAYESGEAQVEVKPAVKQRPPTVKSRGPVPAMQFR